VARNNAARRRTRLISGTIRKPAGAGQAAADGPFGAAETAITCPRGLEDALASELAALGVPVLSVGDTVVTTLATLHECARWNLRLRVAHRVLWLWGEFWASSPEDLYRGVQALRWEDLLRPDRPLMVRAAVGSGRNGPPAGWVALKCKDAIADRMRSRLGRRPDSGPQPDGACVFVRWADRLCRIYLDTTGEPLCFRGYRRDLVVAPLRETLAAGLLIASGWDGRAPLVNPMCGSGTLAIEAAWIAARRAPGLLRRKFAFRHLRTHDEERWRAELDAARRAVQPVRAVIVAADRDPAAVEAARRNARRADVAEDLRIVVADLDRTPLPGPAPWIVVNPEYGRRTGADEAALLAEYRRIGEFFRRAGPSGRGVVITGHLRLARRIGLRLDRRRTVYNGPIECRLLEFALGGPPSSPATERPI